MNLRFWTWFRKPIQSTPTHKTTPSMMTGVEDVVTAFVENWLATKANAVLVQDGAGHFYEPVRLNYLPPGGGVGSFFDYVEGVLRNTVSQLKSHADALSLGTESRPRQVALRPFVHVTDPDGTVFLCGILVL